MSETNNSKTNNDLDFGEFGVYSNTTFEIMGIPVTPFRSYDQALEYVEKIIE